MPVILSQNIDKKSSYNDIPFHLYHYPKVYRNQLKSGDIFIYYQGDKSNAKNRYYFGYGVVGKIEVSEDGEDYFADIINGVPFDQKVPIYYPAGSYYESLAFEKVRKKSRPAWQRSVRKVSDDAFNAILEAAGVNKQEVLSETTQYSEIESNTLDPLSVIKLMNNKYKGVPPEKKDQIIRAHIDRGNKVTNSLKKLLGAVCQICGWIGFEKRNGEKYIEAHHLTQLSFNAKDTLCSDNVILLCPNCHRGVHYSNNFEVEDLGEQILIKLDEYEVKIKKNTVNFLETLQ